MSIGLDALPLAATSYPFVIKTAASEVIEDLHLSSFDLPQVSMWVRGISGLGLSSQDSGSFTPVHAVDILLGNDDDSYVIDTRLFEYREDLWSSTRKVCTWTGGQTVVVATVQIGDARKRGYVFSDGLVDPRAIDWRPAPISDLKLRVGDHYVSVKRSDDTFRFRAGYNTRLLPTTSISSRGENVRDLTIDFAAGAGLGRAPGCDFNTGVRILGGARPNANGDLILSGDHCVNVQPKIQFIGEQASIVRGEFVLKDGCTARCSCDDFTDLMRYTTRTWRRYQDVAVRASEIRDAYNAIVEFMRSAKACAERKPLRTFVWPIRECTFAAAVGICNPSDEPLYNVEIDFRLTDGAEADIGADAACDSIYRIDFHQGQQMPTPYYFESPFPDAKLILRCVPPGTMGYVAFRGVLPDAQADATVKLCAFCPVGGPAPLPNPDPSCYETKLVCPAAENCEESGSSSGNENIVSGETPSGLINGSNAIFTTANTFVPSSVEISVNGLDQKPGVDYVLTGANTLEFAISPEPNDVIIINYRKA